MQNDNRNQTIKDILPYILLFLVVSSLPELLTWATHSDGMTFNGAIVNIDDASVYLSAIRQGSEGKWLFTSQFTPERLPQMISYFPYLLIGKAQKLLGGNILLWYQILRLISGSFALFSLAKLSEEIYPKKLRLQKTSFLLLLLGSGVSWLIIGGSDQIPTFAADLLTPEWNLVTSYLSAPHFILGIGCQAAIFTWAIRLLTHPNLTNLIGLFIFGGLLGASYPFLIPINGLVLAAYFGYEAIQQKTIRWKPLGYFFLATIPMLIFLIYYGYYIPTQPDLAITLLTNNQIAPPSFLGLLAGYGLLLIFALPALRSFTSNEAGKLMLYWFVINLICLYLPINFSGRFILGLFIPISLLAAAGIENNILSRYRDSGFAKSLSVNSFRRVLILLTFPSTFLFLLWTVTGPQTNQDYPFYYHDSEIRAVQWLADRTTSSDLIVADYPISNLIPRYSSARVFHGHLNLTIDLSEKQELLRKFWDPNTTETWKSSFVDAWGVTYIYVGHFERELTVGSFSSPGRLIYDQNGVMIFSLSP